MAPRLPGWLVDAVVGAATVAVAAAATGLCGPDRAVPAPQPHLPAGTDATCRAGTGHAPSCGASPAPPAGWSATPGSG